MSNSKLISYTKLSPNHSGKRTMAIDRITPHCVVGQASVEGLGVVFSQAGGVGPNYGIGSDGRIGLYVNEGNRSWCSSSNANDQRAVTIECTSDATAPYAFNDKVYASLVKLCVDICKRNGKTKLLWLGDKDKSLNYAPKSGEMVLTVHRWFANKSCPGDWMYSRMGKLASEVTAQLTPKTTETKYKVNSAKLNIRKGPSTKYDIVGRITDKGIYSVTQTKKVGCQTWGKLKSGAGWICLSIEYAVKK